MDNLTHSLVGAALGQAGLKKKTGLGMATLIVGANLPDVDAACFFWLDGTQHLAIRRGITHGPIAWVLLPLALAAILWAFDRWQATNGRRPAARDPVSFKWLYLLSLIGCLTHPALDWLNTYGIRLLEPFSSRWYYGDTLFIIDPWLWAMLIAGICISIRRQRRDGDWRRTGRITVAAALAYIGLNGAITAAAEGATRAAFGKDTLAIGSPQPVTFWTRKRLVQLGPHRWGVVNDAAQPNVAQPLARARCAWPNVEAIRRTNADLDAFLFWARAPFAERAADGSVLIRDARFYSPMTRDGFTVPLPEIPCAEPRG